MEIINVSLTPNKVTLLHGYIRVEQQPKPAILLVPGGGFTSIPDKEAEEICLAFFNKGFQTFYLNYHLLIENQEDELMPEPLLDLGRAVKYMKQHKEVLNCSDDLTIIGLSIGGEIVSLFNSLYQNKKLLKKLDYDSNNLKPTRIILGYPVLNFEDHFPKDEQTLNRITAIPEKYNNLSLVNEDCAPVFLWKTENDQIVDSTTCLQYLIQLAKHDIAFESHIFDYGIHGLGLATEQTADDPLKIQPHIAHWFDLAIEWINRN